MIHNPENVESPGEGYRFLTVEEVEKRRFKGEVTFKIEAHRTNGEWSNSGWAGDAHEITYRTKLTPEELEAEG